MRYATSLLLFALLAAAGSASAQMFVRLGSPFGDHMVLQHDAPIVLWGTGAPGGDTVRVSIAGQSAWTRSDWEGRWLVKLNPMKAGGPYQLLIEIGGVGPIVPSPAANGRGGAEINDVLVGEVVLASSLSSRAVIAASAKPSSAHPYAFVRVLQSGTASSPQQWTFVWQDTVPPRSASLFALGADLAARLGMPVGVIETSNGPICSDPDGCSAQADSQTHP